MYVDDTSFLLNPKSSCLQALLKLLETFSHRRERCALQLLRKSSAYRFQLYFNVSSFSDMKTLNIIIMKVKKQTWHHF